MPTRNAIVRLLALSLLLGTGAAAAQQKQNKLYRWVDENGVVHYSDAVPADQSRQDRDILNNQGVRIGSEEGEITAEEREAAARKAAAEEAIRAEKAAKAQRDQVLLDTYLSIAEIEMLRDRRLELLESRIQVTRQYLSNLRKKLIQLQQEASFYQPYSEDPKAPELPENLEIDITRTLASINVYESSLGDIRKEQDVLSEGFAMDIDRFRQLKGL